MVMMMAMTVRPKVDVRGELHGAIWKAVRHSMFAGTLVMMGVGDMILVADELVEALHTETLHLVASTLGGCLGLSHAGNDLAKDTAQDSLTFGVRRVGGDRNGFDGVEDKLHDVNSKALEQHYRRMMLTVPSSCLIAVTSTLSTLIIWPSRPITVTRTVTRVLSSNFFSSYSIL